MGKKREWRNKEDYEFTRRLTMGGWAWEFLRRNPLYIRDWKNALMKRNKWLAPRRKKMAQRIVNLLTEGGGEVELPPNGFGIRINADNMAEKELKLLPLFFKEIRRQASISRGPDLNGDLRSTI